MCSLYKTAAKKNPPSCVKTAKLHILHILLGVIEIDVSTPMRITNITKKLVIILTYTLNLFYHLFYYFIYFYRKMYSLCSLAQNSIVKAVFTLQTSAHIALYFNPTM